MAQGDCCLILVALLVLLVTVGGGMVTSLLQESPLPGWEWILGVDRNLGLYISCDAGYYNRGSGTSCWGQGAVVLWSSQDAVSCV